VIVAAGRGIGEEENLSLLKDLADVLGGVLACSRPIVDRGWLPRGRQVGTSGKSVRPKVYVAVGISGAFQHVAGMVGAGRVIAINRDANAPIFKAADYGIVGDLFQVVPALIEAAKTR
jgi:electron transfer flavoprotein alpha subunit